jgi:mevalonate kinase
MWLTNLTGLERMPETTFFYSHGKLLLTGEYAVIDGTIGLAVPTKYGQFLEVARQADPEILRWQSLDHKNEIWFETTLKISKKSGKLIVANNTNHTETATTLLSVLQAAIELNPSFVDSLTGFEVITRLEFPKDWGLGSSSTFINNVAQWAEVDAFQLLWKGFSGSGYDIACAQHHTPILYRVNSKNPEVTPIDFCPSFKDRLFFVHLNKKQNSREGIMSYKKRSFNRDLLRKKVNQLTKDICNAADFTTFEKLIEEHEAVISEVIGLTPVKERLFADFPGSIKSLGAWGGDFVLVTGKEQMVLDYFRKKKFQTIISYQNMIL